jgi:hypothetical protein
MALLAERGAIVVEIDGLVRHPYHVRSRQYGKGIYLEQGEDGLILLTELAVSHPGGRPSGFGTTRGYYYRPNVDGSWTRSQHPDECDCGRAELHRHHLLVAAHFETLLAEGAFREVRDRVLATSEVVPSSDPAVSRYLQSELAGEPQSSS